MEVMKMSKVVLVTGCAGFIASHVSETLLKRGDIVIGIDEVNDYYDVKQKEENLEILNKYENFKFYKFDFADMDKLKEVFAKHDIKWIAHIGARAGVRPSIEDPFIYEHSNIKGTMNLLELAKENNIENFVLTSSSSVYGDRSKIPFVEDEDTSKAISPYAATKKACEVMAYTYHHLHNLNVNIIRPFTIYGPRGRPDMAPYLFTQKILFGETIKKFGDGTSQRDYTYIDDFVLGFVNAIDRPLGYEIFNLGNENPVSLNEFISTIESITGKTAIFNQMQMQPGDVKTTYANIDKAKKLLDYNPKIKIDVGLKNLYDWLIKPKK
jgi:UDP-glucuronate 4-epimerase